MGMGLGRGMREAVQAPIRQQRGEIRFFTEGVFVQRQVARVVWMVGWTGPGYVLARHGVLVSQIL